MKVKLQDPLITKAPHLPLPLQENIWTFPNVLSLSRILLSPVLGYQVLCERYLLAFSLLGIAAVSDVVSWCSM